MYLLPALQDDIPAGHQTSGCAPGWSATLLRGHHARDPRLRCLTTVRRCGHVKHWLERIPG